MADANAETAERIRVWMRNTLAATGLGISEWASKSRVHKSSIHRALAPTYQYVTSSSTLAKLASGAGVAPPEIAVAGRMPAQEALELPVLHSVAAGAWAAADDLFDDPPETKQVFRVPPFEAYTQWLERVRGDSYNQRIPDGALVHVVDAIEMGYAPRQGDTVVVMRTRAQGAFRERSLKQVEVSRSGIELWPRSHNPRWSAPLHLDEGVPENDDTTEVQIVGLVVQAYIMDL